MQFANLYFVFNNGKCELCGNKDQDSFIRGKLQNWSWQRKHIRTKRDPQHMKFAEFCQYVLKFFTNFWSTKYFNIFYLLIMCEFPSLNMQYILYLDNIMHHMILETAKYHLCQKRSLDSFHHGAPKRERDQSPKREGNHAPSQERDHPPTPDRNHQPNRDRNHPPNRDRNHPPNRKRSHQLNGTTDHPPHRHTDHSQTHPPNLEGNHRQSQDRNYPA